MTHKNMKCTGCHSGCNSLFTKVSYCDISQINDNKNETKVEKGTLLIKSGHPARQIMCLKEGIVLLTKTDDNGNTIAIDIKKEVLFLGIEYFLTEKPYDFDCYTLTPTKICLISRDAFKKFSDNNLPFTQNLLKDISSARHVFYERMLTLTKKQMINRLASAILYIEQNIGTDNEGNLIPVLSRKIWAQLSNMNETNVIRQLAILQSSHIISLKGKKIKIIHKEALVKLSIT